MMVIAGGAAIYEQSKEHANIWIQIGALVIFMYGMMRLSAATPSKNIENDQDDVY